MPQPHTQAVNVEYDLPCLVYSIEDKINIEYRLHCQFLTSQPDTPEQFPFQYLVKETTHLNATQQFITFAIPYPLKIKTMSYPAPNFTDWALTSTVFNMVSITDRSFSSSVSLNSSHIIGATSIFFQYDFHQIFQNSRNYFIGGRLYLENRIVWKGVVAGLQDGKVSMDNFYVDFRDLPSPPPISHPFPTLYVVLILLAALLLFYGGIILYQKIKKLRKKSSLERARQDMENERYGTVIQ